MLWYTPFPFKSSTNASAENKAKGQNISQKSPGTLPAKRKSSATAKDSTTMRASTIIAVSLCGRHIDLHISALPRPNTLQHGTGAKLRVEAPVGGCSDPMREAGGPSTRGKLCRWFPRFRDVPAHRG